MREFYASHIISLNYGMSMHNLSALLLINGIDITILWARLAKRSKEISCSQNLVAARYFYDARRTFYASMQLRESRRKKCETRFKSFSDRDVTAAYLIELLLHLPMYCR